MVQFFSYIFWPNLGTLPYSNPKVLTLLAVSGAFVVLSVVIRVWRKRLSNPVTKKLSRSWAGATLWFGLIGFFLTISRAEGIGYISMRFWWFVWALALLLYLFIQVRVFRARHYTKIDVVRPVDPRDQYLPKKK